MGLILQTACWMQPPPPAPSAKTRRCVTAFGALHPVSVSHSLTPHRRSASGIQPERANTRRLPLPDPGYEAQQAAPRYYVPATAAPPPAAPVPSLTRALSDNALSRRSFLGGSLTRKGLSVRVPERNSNVNAADSRNAAGCDGFPPQPGSAGSSGASPRISNLFFQPNGCMKALIKP